MSVTIYASTDEREQRVVCSALRHKDLDYLILGPRHFDATMHRQIQTHNVYVPFMGVNKNLWYDHSADVEQGFVDQHGVFLTREEAWIVAEKAQQIIRRVGGDGKKLYSENLY